MAGHAFETRDRREALTGTLLRMTTTPIRTVADLISRLQEMEPSAPVVAQNAMTDQVDWIVGVGSRPTQADAIAVVYMPGKPGDAPET